MQLKKLFTDITFESPYITAIKLNATLEVEYEYVTDQDDVVINITLTGKEGETAISTTASSVFTITVNNVPHTVKITKGIGSLTISDLTAGDYVINASWTGSTYYNPIEQLYNLTVSPKKGTFTDLQTQLDNSANGLLILPYNFIYDADYDGDKFVNGVVIDKNMALFNFGDNIVIDGNNKARIFNITNNSIVMLGDVITLANGNASVGGAVYVDAGSTLTGKAINFVNNTAGTAGAVYADGDVTFDGCLFDNNTADNVNGIYVTENGIVSTVSNSNFTGDEFAYNAGSLILKNNVEMSAKVADSYSVYNDGKLQLSGNEFNTRIIDNNEIISDVAAVVLNAGVIDIVDLTYVLNATIVDNNDNVIYNPNVRFTVNGAVIDTIDFNDTTGLYTSVYTVPGIGIYNVSLTEVDGSDIENATLRFIKGTFTDLQNLIYNTVSDLVLPYDFKYDEVIDGDYFPEGVILNVNINIDGNGSTIDANKSSRIMTISPGTTVTINNLTFKNGYANIGGAILTSAESLTIAESRFIGNDPIYGGAIYVAAGESVVKDNTLFENNTAEYGGAICVNNSASLKLDTVTFNNNSANMLVVLFMFLVMMMLKLRTLYSPIIK